MGKLYQFSISEAFEKRLYEGSTSIKKLKQKGNFGLGAFDALDGELLVFERKFYHFVESKIIETKETDLVCWAALLDYKADQEIKITNLNYNEVQEKLYQTFPSRNYPFALKIEGKFNALTLCTVHKEAPPYRTIEEVVANSQSYNFSNIEGIMVGFYSPPYLRDIKATRFHLHFVDKVRKVGGHVLTFDVAEGELGFQKINQMTFELPETDSFQKAFFKDHKIQNELEISKVKPAA